MTKKLRHGLPDFADHLLDAVFLVDSENCIVDVSAACTRIFGYTPEEMIGRVIFDFVAPEDREKTQEEAARIRAGELRIGFENRYLRKDGREVYVMWSARWMEAHGLRVGVARDITGQKYDQMVQAATYAVSDAAHRASDLNALFPEIHLILGKLVPVDGLAIAIRDKTSGELDFPYQSEGLGKGKGGGEVVGEPLARQYCATVIASKQHLVLHDELLPRPLGQPQDQAGHDYLLMPLVALDEAFGVMILKTPSGASFSEKNIEMLAFVSVQIATAIERAQMKAELLRAALFDDLTGLPNRKLFRERINSALSRCQRTHSRIGLLYLDIDDFKYINDAFGHAAGDTVLQEFSRRIRKCVRQMDTVARLGGDEFVILVEDIHGPEDAASVHEKIREVLTSPIVVGGHELQIGTSVGIAITPEDGQTMDALIAAADRAMYRFKAGKPD